MELVEDMVLVQEVEMVQTDLAAVAELEVIIAEGLLEEKVETVL